MIRVISGEKGSGKTKRMIDFANVQAKEAKGVVVYIDDDKRYMYDLAREVRFMDSSEYTEKENYSEDWLYGIVCGMLATNYDISDIFIDAFTKHYGAPLGNADRLIEKLCQLSEKNNVNFVLSVSAEPKDIPDFIAKYAI